MSDQLTDGERFFQEHGYYECKVAPPRKQVLPRTAIDRSDPESQSGPVVASIRARGFHHPWCRWAKNIHKLDKIVYASRHEAIRDGKLPCKYGCQS